MLFFISFFPPAAAAAADLFGVFFLFFTTSLLPPLYVNVFEISSRSADVRTRTCSRTTCRHDVYVRRFLKARGGPQETERTTRVRRWSFLFIYYRCRLLFYFIFSLPRRPNRRWTFFFGFFFARVHTRVKTFSKNRPIQSSNSRDSNTSENITTAANGSSNQSILSCAPFVWLGYLL